MGIELNDCIFKDGNIGISVEGQVPVKISGTDFIRMNRAIEIRESSSIIQQLGLPADTPPELLMEALDKLRSMGNAPTDEKVSVFKASRLFDFLTTSLGNSAAVATILGTLKQFGIT